MQRMWIQREIPNAGKLTPQELQGISREVLQHPAETWSPGAVAGKFCYR